MGRMVQDSHVLNRGVRLEGQKTEAAVGLFWDCGARSVVFTTVSEIWLILLGASKAFLIDLYPIRLCLTEGLGYKGTKVDLCQVGET